MKRDIILAVLLALGFGLIAIGLVRKEMHGM